MRAAAWNRSPSPKNAVLDKEHRMEFFAAILSYPTLVYTILLGVGLVYWMLAIIGLVDFESGGPDLDVDLDAGEAGDAGDAGDAESDPHVSTLAGYLVALGLGGVPFSVVVSLLTLFAWVISSIASLWVLAFLPPGLLRFLVASVVLVGALALAIPAAAVCVRPLRKLFVTHNAISNASLVGQECVVLTSSVDEKFGRAEVPARGAGYHIRIVADTPNDLKRGDTAFIVEYDETARIYRVAKNTPP
jgi:hypothetical protein